MLNADKPPLDSHAQDCIKLAELAVTCVRSRSMATLRLRIVEHVLRYPSIYGSVEGLPYSELVERGK